MQFTWFNWARTIWEPVKILEVLLSLVELSGLPVMILLPFMILVVVAAAGFCYFQAKKYRRMVESLKVESLKVESEHKETVEKLRKAGYLLIDFYGNELSPLKLSVAVQFVDQVDIALAKKVAQCFGRAWTVGRIEKIGWRDNPSNCRIVIFSSHQYSRGVCRALIDYDLINGESIELVSKEQDMEEDLTIIIFDGQES